MNERVIKKGGAKMKRILGIVLLLSVIFLAACEAEKPADFELSSVTVSPSTTFIGDTVIISATITNKGGVPDGCVVNLTIDGYTNSTSIGTLVGDESTNVRFTYTTKSIGSYTITLSTPNATVTRSLTVREIGHVPEFPFWYIGDSWVYDCTYENPAGTPKYDPCELSLICSGEVAAGAVEGLLETSYHLNGSFTPQAMRDSIAAGMTLVLHVGTADVYNVKSSLQLVKMCSSIKELPGLPACVTWSYTTSPSWPITVGETWTFTKHTVAGGGMIDELVNREGKMLDVVDITVPAGTFSCYYIVEYDPANPDTYTYEHWFNGTVKSDVKQIDRGTWAGAETRVLKSYSVS